MSQSRTLTACHSANYLAQGKQSNTALLYMCVLFRSVWQMDATIHSYFFMPNIYVHILYVWLCNSCFRDLSEFAEATDFHGLSIRVFSFVAFQSVAFPSLDYRLSTIDSRLLTLE